MPSYALYHQIHVNWHLPKRVDRIFGDVGVRGEDRQAMHNGLADEYAVERIVVPFR